MMFVRSGRRGQTARRGLVVTGAVALSLVALMVGPVQQARAATTVIGCGPTPLGNGLALATAVGAAASGDLITLAAPCEYSPPTLPLIITTNITIRGGGSPGSAGAVIDSTSGGSPSPRLIEVNNASSTPVVLDNLTLDGSKGQGGGKGLDGVAVASGGAVTISNSIVEHFLGVAGGVPFGPGGCADTDDGAALCFEGGASATLTADTFQHNTAQVDGGAIFFVGGGPGPLTPFTATNTVFDDNHTLTTSPALPGGGGAINLIGAMASLTGDTFSNNSVAHGSGGAVTTFFTELDVTNSTFTGNAAHSQAGLGCLTLGSGGAIENGWAGTPAGASITGSTFVGNHADEVGGAVDNGPGGALEVSASTFGAPSAVDSNVAAGGGALSTQAGSAAPICPPSSAAGISPNGFPRAARPAGWQPLSPGATITDSTFDHNQGTFGGGAVLGISTLPTSILTSTIDDNFSLGGGPGGAVSVAIGDVTVASTILSQNPSGNCSTGSGTITDNGNNLTWPASDTSCPATFASGDPLLDTLAANGGPTKTQGLNQGSAALSKLPFGTTGCGTTDTDQRGVNRQAASPGDKCDIGALEVVSTSSVVTMPATAVAGTAVPITDTITESAPLKGAKPLGTVSFFDGSTAIGTAPSDPGTAVLTASTLIPGTHSISARYPGSSIFDPSAASPVSISISVPVPATGSAGTSAGAGPSAGALGTALIVLGTGIVGTASRRRRTRRRSPRA